MKDELAHLLTCSLEVSAFGGSTDKNVCPTNSKKAGMSVLPIQNSEDPDEIADILGLTGKYFRLFPKRLDKLAVIY